MATLEELLKQNEDNNNYLAEGVIVAYVKNIGKDYLGGYDVDGLLQEIEDAYAGEFASDEEFAQEMAESVGASVGNDWPNYCIDWKYAARELMYDYFTEDGFYFRGV